jgi:hypothetical protein
VTSTSYLVSAGKPDATPKQRTSTLLPLQPPTVHQLGEVSDVTFTFPFESVRPANVREYVPAAERVPVTAPALELKVFAGSKSAMSLRFVLLAVVSASCAILGCAPRTLEGCAARARNTLGEDTRTAIVASKYVFVDARGFGWNEATFPDDVAFGEATIAALLHGRFSRLPSEPVSVYLFPSAIPYEAFCASEIGGECLSPYGFYRRNQRMILLDAGLGVGTLSHELVHTLVEADFDGAPAWLDEGIASLFEAPVLPAPGEIHGARNWRHPGLVAALRREDPTTRPTIARLFGMSNGTFRGPDEGLHYALARELCMWLDVRDRLWPFYRRFRDGVSTDPTGARAFEDVVGASPEKAHAEFAQWVLAP